MRVFLVRGKEPSENAALQLSGDGAMEAKLDTDRIKELR